MAYVIDNFGLFGLMLFGFFAATVLPVIGDPVTYLAGALRINFYLFIFVAASLRFLRYLVIAGFF